MTVLRNEIILQVGNKVNNLKQKLKPKQLN